MLTGDDIGDFGSYRDKYSYQNELTEKLDSLGKGSTDFHQDILNEIILWKVNRYVQFPVQVIDSLNKIGNAPSIDKEITRKVLSGLLELKGVDIAMASTILRFKNPSCFQIIDQRVYRLLYGKELKKTTVKEKKINTYLQYLKDLKEFCERRQIDFTLADRIFYEADKDVNKGRKIQY